MLRPIRNRILIRPDAAETETASGLVIPDNAKDRYAMSGEVIALGPECHGPAYRIRAAVLASVEERLDRVNAEAGIADLEHHDFIEAFRGELRALLANFYDAAADSVQVGMHVCFPSECATDVSEGKEPLILVKESDLSAAWEPDEAAVEVPRVA